MSLDETKQKGDVVVKDNGIKIVYTNQIAGHVERATVDYRDKWYDKGFRLVGMPYGSC